MRDSKRIGPLLQAVEKAWRRYPDLRLAQLIMNLVDDYHTSDEELLKRIEVIYLNKKQPKEVGKNVGDKKDTGRGRKGNGRSDGKGK